MFKSELPTGLYGGFGLGGGFADLRRLEEAGVTYKRKTGDESLYYRVDATTYAVPMSTTPAYGNLAAAMKNGVIVFPKRRKIVNRLTLAPRVGGPDKPEP